MTVKASCAPPRSTVRVIAVPAAPSMRLESLDSWPSRLAPRLDTWVAPTATSTSPLRSPARSAGWPWSTSSAASSVGSCPLAQRVAPAHISSMEIPMLPLRSWLTAAVNCWYSLLVK